MARKSPPAYIELHASSAFSFLRGACKPEDLARQAAKLEIPAFALCDRDGFYGSPRAHHSAQELGLKAHVGTELVLSDQSVIPILAETQEGYRNLCKLLTISKLRSPKGEAHIDWEELAEHKKGLIALTGDLEGPLLRKWPHAGTQGIEAGFKQLHRIFGSQHLYIEIQRHRVRDEDIPNKLLVELATSFDLPLLATNGVRYATPPGRRVCDVFTCLRHHTHLDAAGRLLQANHERHLKTAAEMRALFADLPKAIEETLHLSERLEFSLKDLGYAFPIYPTEPGDNMDALLRREVYAGARRRYQTISPKIRKQLDYELGLIQRLGFSGYFLIVWDIVRFCENEHIMVQGRGSAANSAVCYCLGITACDPISGKLLFERFLSEGRKAWPDIDLDLPSGDRRERVIQEIYRRYGHTGAAMTANVITYRGRSAIREIGKVLNFPEEAISRFSALSPRGDYPHTLDLENQLEQSGIRADHPRAPALKKLYEQIYGLPRHLGQHSGGMVICQGRLDSIVPLENASMPGRSVVQWDKDDCEQLGIIKVDLLGLGMMAAIQDAITLASERKRPIDLAKIPKDDPATYDLMCAADTIGVFQIESRAQMATLPRMKPRHFYDLVVEVAIIRPGPIVGQLAHPYLERRAGKEPITYIDQRLVPVLERTLGIPLFQEQVLKMAMVMANFSGSQAERLRKALSFHRSEVLMNRVKTELETALTANGIAPEIRERVVTAISSFALYGFPESHAISFAMLAYSSAYLKVHYSEEFYTGLLNNQPMGFYSAATLIQDAKRRGLRFEAPCVKNASWLATIPGEKRIRLGLRMLKNVGKPSILHMLDIRDEQPFSSIFDFCRRTRFNPSELRVLASAGALNALAGDRRSALWAVESSSIQTNDLFNNPNTELIETNTPLQPMSWQERVRTDFATTGVTVGAHPMRQIRDSLPRHMRCATDLEQCSNDSFVAIAGAVICRQRPGTARGVVFISLEDETGIANIIVYPKMFEERRLTIVSEPFLKIYGIVQKAEGTIHIKARRIEPMLAPELPAGASHDFH
ncbi:MAG: error-prone DNA polymerase [Verrucomicrobiota bacterium]